VVGVGLSSKIIVSNKLREFIIPLSKEEFIQLEKNIIKEGCRDPLVIWNRNKKPPILVDGHNRYKICLKHGIPFGVKEIGFKDLTEVQLWMLNNQMGRRNLTPDQLSYYRGLRYLNLKKSRGGYDNVKLKGQNDVTTSEVIASIYNVSESTIKRDAKYAEGLNMIGKSNPRLKLKILNGDLDVKKTDVQVLTESKETNLIIRNEADLFNKAKKIRKEAIEILERKVAKVYDEDLNKSQKILKEIEPIFINKDDKLKRLKGMIISAMNRAIIKRDATAASELRELISKLIDEIR